LGDRPGCAAVLVTASIGDVIGISLLSHCAFGLGREKTASGSRHSFIAVPRSADLLCIRHPAHSRRRK
jgi:hypothetical protein